MKRGRSGRRLSICAGGVQVGHSACRAAGVQLLDQTVHAAGLRLRRRDDGRLGLERSFRFEYSYDGVDRHIGKMILRGDKLVSFIGPARPSVAPIDLH